MGKFQILLNGWGILVEATVYSIMPGGVPEKRQGYLESFRIFS